MIEAYDILTMNMIKDNVNKNKLILYYSSFWEEDIP